MSKQRRICFVPNKVIGDEVFKKLEELGFKRNGNYPSEYENLRSDYVLIEKNNEIEDWSGNERSYKERDLDFHDATEVSINDIFEGRVKPYKQSNLMTLQEVEKRLENGEGPLDLSIEKYERLIEADFDDIEVRHIDSRSCACCQKYKDPACVKCPIAEITGRTDCRGISYYSVEIAFNTSIKSFFECVNRVLEELKGIRKKMKKKKNIIKCPFKMQRGFNAGDGLGIPFNDQKQTLFYSDFGSVYKVTSCNRSHLIPCNLILTNKDDLKVGDTYFHCDLEISKNNPIEAYGIDGFCKYLGNSEYVYPCFGVTVSSSDWKYWYKVVPKEK